MDRQRRRILKLGGIAATTALAGCSGLSGDSGDTTPTQTATDTATATATATETPEAVSIDYGDWFAETDNFDGTTVDARGQDSLSVTVGAQGNNGGPFAFDPPAVHVDPGTTVTWEWTGNGTHNVVAENGAFESGDATSDASTTFEYAFDEEGMFKYFCRPHRGLGMRGAVVVGDPAAGSDGDDGGTQYDWQAATFDSYWYSLYNMSTNIAMSGNGVTFPANDQQRQQFQQRIQGITSAANVDQPPINNPNLNMAPFTTGDPHFTQQPVFSDETDRPNAATLQWDKSNSSGVVSPSSLGWTHLKGVTWAKNFEKHFDILPADIAPKFRAQVLSTLAQLGVRFSLAQGNLRANDENLMLVSEFDPMAGSVTDSTPRVQHHTAMLWFLSDLVSLAQGGWFGYENPEPLIPASRVQELADNLAKTVMNAFEPADVVSQSTRDAGALLGGLGWYGTHAGSSQLQGMAAEYANSLADGIADATDGNGHVGNGAANQAATQGIVGQGLLWASQVDGVDRTTLASDALGYLVEELFDADAGTFADGSDSDTYTITARDAGDITGGLNAADAVLNRSGVKDVYTQFFDATFNTGGLQRAQRQPSVSDRENEPPLPPAAGGEFGQAAVYNAEVAFDTASNSWTVTDDTFHTADALYLANQDIWVGNWAGDFFQGRGVPGQSDTPPN